MITELTNIEPEHIHAETIPADEVKPKVTFKVNSVLAGLFILGMTVGAILSKPKKADPTVE